MLTIQIPLENFSWAMIIELQSISMVCAHCEANSTHKIILYFFNAQYMSNASFSMEDHLIWDPLKVRSEI